MNAPSSSSPDASRRDFFRKIAGGAVLAGTTAYAHAAEKNPFAYDVDRFARTDPALIGWEEISRRTCPVPGARRVVVGPGDIVHVAAGNQVVRWNAEANLPTIDLGAMVTALAFAADGTLFVALRQRVVTIAPDGTRGPDLIDGGAKAWISGLAVSGRDVWLADSGQRIVWRHDRAGKLLGRLGAKDPARNVPGFVVPSPFLDVRLHPDGLLRINNPGRHRVEAYTTDGDFELAFGEPTAGIRGFCGCCNPIGLAVLPDGRYVTCEKGLPRVKIYRADGTFESVVAGTETFAAQRRAHADPNGSPNGGLDVAVDSARRLYLLDRVTGEVRVMREKARV